MAARAVACDAMIIPVVTGDIDAGAVEELIALCVRYHRLRTAPGPAPDAPSSPGSDGSPGGDGSAAVPAGLIGSAAARAGRLRWSPLRWPSWSTRSWARSCRSSPARAGSRLSCAASCSARA